MKVKTLMRTAALGALAVGLLLAQPPMGAFGQGGRRMGARGKVFRELLSGYLGLSDAQKAQAKTIFGNARQSAKPILDQLKTTRAGLNAAIMAGQPTDQLAAQQGALIGKLIAIRAGAREQFRALLTPEQQQKLQQLFASLKSRRGQRPSRNG